MGQYQSYNDSFLSKEMIKIEEELLKLKAIQRYSPSQINYSYQSNSVTVDSYVWATPASYIDNHHGIVACFTFTSYFPNIYPRVSMVRLNYRENTYNGVLLSYRTEKAGANKVRIYVQYSDTVIPMDSPHPFTVELAMKSNVSGVFALEKTYVVPVGD